MKYLAILFLLFSQASFGCYFPTIHNSFLISVTENDKILINQKQSTLKNLSNQIYDYYSVNSVAQESDAFATYETLTTQDCQSQINSIAESNYHRSWIEKEKRHWEVKLYVLKNLNLNKYRFPSTETYIQIGVKRKTSYNMYIQVLSKIKETIGKLRNEKALALFNISYDSILSKQNEPKMKTYKYITDVLVPEWIFDLPLTN